MPRRPYKVGVLFVHGMGEAERGDTVTQMGDSLSEWLRRWIEQSPGQDFKIRGARLREDSDAAQGETGVSVVLTDADGRSQVWLLAESWWAGAFRPATFGELAVWAVSVGPWLIASQASGILSQLGGGRGAGGGDSLSWLPLLRRATSIVLVILAAVAAAVV